MNIRNLLLALGLVLSIPPAHAQPVDPKYKDYFLMGRFGEVCTMCEVIVLCAAGEEIPTYESVPDTGTFTLYYIQTRTFWSQVSTIWEWFVKNFSKGEEGLAARGHTRPVFRYQIIDGQWSGKEILEAMLVLDPGRLEFGEHTIDRVNQGWSINHDEQVIGFCQRMPLWDAIEKIDTQAPGEKQ